MKPDSEASHPGPPAAAPTRDSRLDKIERAHLKDPGDASHQMFRYGAPPGLDGFLERFWIPVWSVPPGQEAPQKVLQFPVCLLVVTAEYARFYGVVSGLSTTTLTGDGWAVGVMLAPAAGYLVARRPVAEYTDRFVDLGEVLGDAGTALTARVRAAMRDSPASPDAHRQAMEEYHAALGAFLPVDEEGRLVNRLVELVESRRDILRVAQVCEELNLSERALQRLVHRRIGLTPKWLIQRRRLQEAAERLRDRSVSSGEVAALLGYADQPHFIRDFSRVTSMTPGEYAARHVR